MVCVERMQIGQRISRLPCGHRFHAKCLLTWLARSASCPYCRYTLAEEEEEEEGDECSREAAMRDWDGPRGAGGMGPSPTTDFTSCVSTVVSVDGLAGGGCWWWREVPRGPYTSVPL